MKEDFTGEVCVIRFCNEAGRVALWPLLKRLVEIGDIAVEHRTGGRSIEARLGEMLRPRISLYIRQKKDWAALYRAMTDKGMVRMSQGQWVKWVNGLFPEMEEERRCTYHSLRQGLKHVSESLREDFAQLFTQG